MASAAPLKVLLTGATGTAGSAALRQLICDQAVTAVTVLTRRPLQPSQLHPKVSVIIHTDFNTYADLLPQQLQGHSACLWCLGISQTQASPEEYVTITRDYPVAAAAALAASLAPPGRDGAPFAFCYLSGDGADPSGKSRVLFARVKGEAENALAALPAAQSGALKVYSFRPGFIQPPAGSGPSPFLVRLGNWLAPLMKAVAPSMVVPADNLGKALVYVAKNGYSKGILSRGDIRELVQAINAAGGTA